MVHNYQNNNTSTSSSSQLDISTFDINAKAWYPSSNSFNSNSSLQFINKSTNHYNLPVSASHQTQLLGNYTQKNTNLFCLPISSAVEADNTKHQANNGQKMFCSWCFKGGRDCAHRLKDSQGNITCPDLLKKSCQYCHQPGHFMSHCKKREEDMKAKESQFLAEKQRKQSSSNNSTASASDSLGSDDDNMTICSNDSTEQDLMLQQCFAVPLPAKVSTIGTELENTVERRIAQLVRLCESYSGSRLYQLF